MQGFGIDRTAVAADARTAGPPRLAGAAAGEPRHRPAAAARGDPGHHRGARPPRPTAGCRSPATGPARGGLRLLVERSGHRYDPEARSSITSGGTEADARLRCSRPSTPATRSSSPTRPTPASSTASASPAACRASPRTGRGRRVAARPRRARAPRRATRPRDLLMSPSMPSGAVLTEEEWGAVCDSAGDHDLLLVYDAAMERLLFDGRPLVHPLRFDGMAERTVIVGSLSKELRMIGWRVGWVAGPAELVERSAGCTSTTRRPRRASPARRHRGPARRPGPRRGRRRRAPAPARHDPRRARRLAAWSAPAAAGRC